MSSEIVSGKTIETSPLHCYKFIVLNMFVKVLCIIFISIETGRKQRINFVIKQLLLVSEVNNNNIFSARSVQTFKFFIRNSFSLCFRSCKFYGFTNEIWIFLRFLIIKLLYIFGSLNVLTFYDTFTGIRLYLQDIDGFFFTLVHYRWSIFTQAHL